MKRNTDDQKRCNALFYSIQGNVSAENQRKRETESTKTGTEQPLAGLLLVHLPIWVTSHVENVDFFAFLSISRNRIKTNVFRKQVNKLDMTRYTDLC